MAIFGRMAARQRLRRATEESFTVPTFSTPLDCTPWVLGGLWPVALSSVSDETSTLAEYLKIDLQKIADSANDELRAISQLGMAYSVRRAAEARVINEARARAVRRVESMTRQLRQMPPHAPPLGARPDSVRSDLERTQVLPVLRDVPAHADLDATQVLPAITDPPAEVEPAPQDDRPPEPAPHVEGDEDRLQRLVAFTARQEPRLSWAVGDHTDGTTVLVTDLAHGWIPPGVRLPEGVRVLEPDRRIGRVAELMKAAKRSAAYVPGDSSSWLTDFPDTTSSAEAFELPVVDDLGWELGVATHWRDGLPRMVNTLAKAAAAGADITEQEIDLLRVHLDTARYQILAQYPAVDLAALLNCMLLAATEGSVTGDPVSANYHFAWFKKLDAAPDGQAVEPGPSVN